MSGRISFGNTCKRSPIRRCKLVHFFLNFSKKSNEFLLEQRQRASNDLEQLVDQFEADNGVSLAVLTPLILYVCPDCQSSVKEDKFKKGRCSCGTK